MALTLPTIEELGEFRNEPFPDDATDPEVERAESILQQAADAIWVFTGIESDPVDTRVARILKNAIMDLTLWLMAQYENRDEINSPFTSERIGSYSYSKMMAAQRGEESGIWWLDLLFKYLGSQTDSDAVGSWSHAENVMNPCGLTYEQILAREKAFGLHDPSTTIFLVND
jgi:hypothetical protein